MCKILNRAEVLKCVPVCMYFRDLDIFEPPRFMSINTAVEQLLEVVEKKKQGKT